MTKYYSERHHRKSIRLQEYDYSQEGAYFVTICIHEMKCMFGRINNGSMTLNKHGVIAYEEWMRTKVIRPNVSLDAFVIMPNHIHGIIVIECRGVLHTPSWTETSRFDGRMQYAPTSQLSSNVNGRMQYAPTSQLSSNVNGRMQYAPTFRSPSQTLGAIIRGFKSTTYRLINENKHICNIPLWQRNYFEYIIRNEFDLLRIREYITNNPFEWGKDEYYPSYGL